MSGIRSKTIAREMERSTTCNWVLTAICITVGFHRHFTHRAFDTARWLRTFLGVGEMMAAPGPVISWVATHRCHHQFSDRDGDPHSPNLSGLGAVAMIKGLWHAHFGWMAEHQFPNPAFYAPDLLRDTHIVRLNRRYYHWVILGLMLPMVAGFSLTRNWQGGISALMWGGFIRLSMFQQIASAVNSVCHLFGTRPFRTSDGSRNNFLVAVASCGEGLHNNHHAFPSSAYLGLRWWQIDLGGLLVHTLKHLGLIWNVRCPAAADMKNRSTHGSYLAASE